MERAIERNDDLVKERIRAKTLLKANKVRTEV